MPRAMNSWHESRFMGSTQIMRVFCPGVTLTALKNWPFQSLSTRRLPSSSLSLNSKYEFPRL
jgi:hypothetical protein